MYKKNRVLSAAQAFTLALCIPVTISCTQSLPVQQKVIAAPKLDIQKYLGTWYEVASLPNPFQKDCYATQATYSIAADGRNIKVINACRRGGLNKELTSKQGTAWQPHSEFSSKLKVQFFWPFSGDYWVLAVAPDYSWAVVGQPSRRYLWFLSRTRALPQNILFQMKKVALEQGYDLSMLSLTVQPQG